MWTNVCAPGRASWLDDERISPRSSRSSTCSRAICIRSLAPRYVRAIAAPPIVRPTPGTSIRSCARASGGAGEAPPDHRQHGAAGDAFGTLLPDIRLEPHQAESRLELDDLRRDLVSLGERVAALAGEGSLNRGERARFRLPRRAIGVVPFGLQQRFVGHPAAERALDRRRIA